MNRCTLLIKWQRALPEPEIGTRHIQALGGVYYGYDRRRNEIDHDSFFGDEEPFNTYALEFKCEEVLHIQEFQNATKVSITCPWGYIRKMAKPHISYSNGYYSSFYKFDKEALLKDLLRRGKLAEVGKKRVTFLSRLFGLTECVQSPDELYEEIRATLDTEEETK